MLQKIVLVSLLLGLFGLVGISHGAVPKCSDYLSKQKPQWMAQVRGFAASWTRTTPQKTGVVNSQAVAYAEADQNALLVAIDVHRSIGYMFYDQERTNESFVEFLNRVFSEAGRPENLVFAFFGNSTSSSPNEFKAYEQAVLGELSSRNIQDEQIANYFASESNPGAFDVVVEMTSGKILYAPKAVSESK